MRSKKQRLYKMKGCSKSKKNRRSRNSSFKKRYLGGTSRGELAYPTTGIIFQKPPLAYMKGGNNKSAAYPSPGPPMRPTGVNWLNVQVGGNGLPYGQGLPEMKGIPYPNGLTGNAWGPNLNWPATSNVVANNNHYALNTYSPNDVPLQIINEGANPPFLGFGGGKKKKRIAKNKTKRRRGKMNGGMFVQDLVNVGRQTQTGITNTYHTLKGVDASPSPLPWQDQFPLRR